MSKPKRHHWWPMAQSSHWTDRSGKVFVTRRDGSYFKANPINIGVESELYTRFADDGSKDTAIEQWFADTIDGTISSVLDYFLDSGNLRSREHRGDPTQAKTLKTLGYLVKKRVQYFPFADAPRAALASYIAALLVRHPEYLAKLTDFHSNDPQLRDSRSAALDNMVYLHGVYSDKVAESTLIITRRAGAAEYLFADGGLVVKEPWGDPKGLPFDIHTPLTPDLAIQVFPMPTGMNLTEVSVMDANTQGVARQNRIILAAANRFVFCRGVPPSKFIAKHFGQPAPELYGYRFVNGKLETRYYPDRQ